jgi:hypothetical protein
VTDQHHPILERQAPTSSHVSCFGGAGLCCSCCLKTATAIELSIHLCSCLLVRGNMSCVHEFIFRGAEDGSSSASCYTTTLDFRLSHSAVSSLNRSMCRPDVLCSSLSTVDSSYFVSMRYWMRRSL